MAGTSQKDIGKIRDIGKKDLVLTVCTVLLAAAVIVLSMMARIEITQLSDESASLTEEIADLEEQKHTLEVTYEFSYNLSSIERQAQEQGMTSPSEVGAVFIDKPTEDELVVYDKGTESMDKPKDIYAYFGW